MVDKQLRRKYIERHRRRHGHRPALDRAWRNLQHFLRKTFNIREGRAPYHVIRKRFVNGARLTGTHLSILIVAMVIACIGLDTDSDIAIIGAMLICPIMGSVLAIAYGAATLDRAMMRDAVSGLLVQMTFCLVTSTIYFAISPGSVMTRSLADNSSATVWDLMLALVGGFAGGLGNSRDQEPATVIAGVAVATALMPPLCSVGYGISAMNLELALAALYEFGINVAFIALSAMMVLLTLRVPLKRDLDDDGVVTEAEEERVRTESHKIRQHILTGTAVFAIPCLLLTGNAVASAEEEAAATDYYSASETARELGVICPGFEEYSIGMEASAGRQLRIDATGQLEEGSEEQLVARVVTSRAMSAKERATAEELIRLDVPEVNRVEFAVE